MTEALGMMLPGGACIPAVQADRLRHAEASGARAVAMAAERLSPERVMTPKAFTNSLRVLLALGGSTNGLIHMTAVAGRLGVEIDLEALDVMSRETPVLVDLKPSGQHYMEDLERAGGLVAVLRELEPLLHLDCLTVTGLHGGSGARRRPGRGAARTRAAAAPRLPDRDRPHARRGDRGGAAGLAPAGGAAHDRPDNA
jgi:dihydroxy-acid dehydratase